MPESLTDDQLRTLIETERDERKAADKGLAERLAVLEQAVEPPPVDPPPVDPPPVDPPPAASGRPFLPSSPWNTKLPAGLTAHQRRSATLRSCGRLWANSGSNSHPIYPAGPRSFTVIDDTHGNDPTWPGLRGPISWPVPQDAVPAPGDGHLHVRSADGTKMLETISAYWSGGALHCTRMAVVDLTGDGLGPQNGTRAYGGSAVAGLITDRDIDAGVIDHALAIALPTSGLFIATPGGDWGYVLAGALKGFGRALGYLVKALGGIATEQDYDSLNPYTGKVGGGYNRSPDALPMGIRVWLPASVNIDALGLPKSARMVALALQTYGAWIVDRCGDGDVCLYVQQSAKGNAFGAELTGPNWSRQHLLKIQPQLVSA